MHQIIQPLRAILDHPSTPSSSGSSGSTSSGSGSSSGQGSAGSPSSDTSSGVVSGGSSSNNPTPSSQGGSTAHCDRPGYPSCSSLGSEAGKNAAGTSCPPGHSKAFCSAYNVAAGSIHYYYYQARLFHSKREYFSKLSR